jgi:hypothetical protein
MGHGHVSGPGLAMVKEGLGAWASSSLGMPGVSQGGPALRRRGLWQSKPARSPANRNQGGAPGLERRQGPNPTRSIAACWKSGVIRHGA